MGHISRSSGQFGRSAGQQRMMTCSIYELGPIFIWYVGMLAGRYLDEKEMGKYAGEQVGRWQVRAYEI